MSVQHEDTLDFKRHKTEEGVKAEEKVKDRPLEKDGLKPRPETIQKLKALHHIIPTKTFIQPEDPKYTSPTRWVGLDEHGKWVFLYRKPNIAELKYNYVMEKNPYYVEHPLKKTHTPLPTHSIHNKPILKHDLDFEPERIPTRPLVSYQPPPISTNVKSVGTSVLYQIVADKPPVRGRRLGGDNWSKDDAILSSRASNQAYESNPTLSGYTVSSIDNNENSFKIVVFKSSDTTILAIRGTVGLTNWKTNATLDLKQYTGYSAHGGYSRILEIPAINSSIKSVLNNIQGRLILTGHSAGGGYAMLIRKMFSDIINRIRTVRVYTYGQPSVFDGAGALLYNSEYLNETFRVYNPYDYVPYTPPYPFHHAGCDVIIKQDLFMIDANGFNEALVSIQSLFDAFITPMFIGAVKNYNTSKQRINSATSSLTTQQRTSENMEFDLADLNTQLQSKRGMRISTKNAIRLRSVEYRIDQYKQGVAQDAVQAYIKSIGKELNRTTLRSGRVVYSNQELTTAEELETIQIKNDTLDRLKNYSQLPTDIKALVDEGISIRGQFNIPDSVYNVITQLAQIAPYGIAGVAMLSFIAKEHSMNSYQQYMENLPTSQSSVWTNIFDTIRSGIALVYSYFSAFKGETPLFGGGSYIPYTPIDRTNDPILKKMSEDVWKSLTERDKKQQNDALDEMREIIPIDGYSKDECPPIRREDIVGLVSFTPTNPDNCGIQGLISVP